MLQPSIPPSKPRHIDYTQRAKLNAPPSAIACYGRFYPRGANAGQLGWLGFCNAHGSLQKFSVAGWFLFYKRVAIESFVRAATLSESIFFFFILRGSRTAVSLGQPHISGMGPAYISAYVFARDPAFGW